MNVSKQGGVSMNEVHGTEIPVENRLVAGQYVLEPLLAETSLATFFRARDQMTLEADGTESPLILAAIAPKLVEFPAFESTLQRVLEEFDRPDSPLSIAGAYRDKETCWLIYNESEGKTITELLEGRGEQHFSVQEAQPILFNIFRAARHFMSRGGFGFLEPGAVLCFRNNYKLLNAPLAVVLRVLSGVAGSVNEQLQLRSAYLSPEVARGILPSSQDDTFSIASIAYELLSGRKPFGDTTTLEAGTSGLSPMPLAQLGAPGWKALQQGLSLQRSKRQASPYTLLQGFAGSTAGMEDLADKPAIKVTGKNGVLAKAAVLAGLSVLIGYGSYQLYQGTSVSPTVVAQSEVASESSVPPVVSEPAKQAEQNVEQPLGTPEVALLKTPSPAASGSTFKDEQPVIEPVAEEGELARTLDTDTDNAIEKAIIASAEQPASDQQTVAESDETSNIVQEVANLETEKPESRGTPESIVATAAVKSEEIENTSEKHSSTKVASSVLSNEKKITATVRSPAAPRHPAVPRSPAAPQRVAVSEPVRQAPPVRRPVQISPSPVQPPIARRAPAPAPNRVVAVSPGTFVVVAPSSAKTSSAPKRVKQIGESTFVVAVD